MEQKPPRLSHHGIREGLSKKQAIDHLNPGGEKGCRERMWKRADQVLRTDRGPREASLARTTFSLSLSHTRDPFDNSNRGYIYFLLGLAGWGSRQMKAPGCAGPQWLPGGVTESVRVCQALSDPSRAEREPMGVEVTQVLGLAQV